MNRFCRSSRIAAPLLLLFALACGGGGEERDPPPPAPTQYATERERMQRTAVPLTSKVEGSVLRFTDDSPNVTYFALNAQQGHKYFFACAPRTITTCTVRLYDAQGAELGWLRGAPGEGFFLHYRAPTSGMYYFAITGSPAKGEFSYGYEDLGADDHPDFAVHAPAPLPPQRSRLLMGTIDVAGDHDLFPLAATAGHLYRFTCTMPAPWPIRGWQLELLDGDGQPMPFPLQPAVSGANVVFEFTAFTTQTVLFSVSADFDSSTLGAFSCEHVDLSLDDHADQPEEATPATEHAAGRINTEGDVDFFAVQLEANHAYEVSCAVGSLQGCKLEVRDPSGQAVQRTSDSVTFLKAEEAGRYTLRVTAPLNTEYGLYIEDLGPDDRGDTRAESTPLSAPGYAFSGTIEYERDRDAYTFEGVPDHLFRVSCDPPAVEWSWELAVWDAADTLLHSTSMLDSGGDRSLVVKTLDAGPHLVAVGNLFNLGRTGSYTCRAVDLGPELFGGTPQTATPIAFPGGAIGDFEIRNDVDMFALTVNAVRVVNANCSILSSAGDCVMRIRDSAGTLLQEKLFNDNRAFELPAAGTYTIEVSHRTGATGRYNLYVSDLGVDDHGAGADDATPFVEGTPIEGRSYGPDDVDAFVFTSGVNTSYRLSCPVGSCTLSVSSASGSLVSGSHWGYTYVRSPIGEAVVVSVRASSDAFSLLLEAVSGDDHGNTPASATTLPLGQSLTASIEQIVDVDVFALTLAEARSYNVALLSGLPLLPSLQGPSGSPVGVDAQGNFTAPQSGTYFLSVGNDMWSGNAWAGGYSVQVR